MVPRFGGRGAARDEPPRVLFGGDLQGLLWGSLRSWRSQFGWGKGGEEGLIEGSLRGYGGEGEEHRAAILGTEEVPEGSVWGEGGEMGLQGVVGEGVEGAGIRGS